LLLRPQRLRRQRTPNYLKRRRLCQKEEAGGGIYICEERVCDCHVPRQTDNGCNNLNSSRYEKKDEWTHELELKEEGFKKREYVDLF
jgi:hypothetical protein